MRTICRLIEANSWASVSILVEDGIDVMRKLDELGIVSSLRKFGQPPVWLFLEKRRVQVAPGIPFVVGDVLQAGCHQHQSRLPVGGSSCDAGLPSDFPA